MPIVTEKQPNRMVWLLPVVVAAILIYAVYSFMQTLGAKVKKLNNALTPAAEQAKK